MTTIAATLDALAGDRMVTDGSSATWYPAVKVRRIKGAVIGAAGDAGDATRLMDWAEHGFAEKKRPKFLLAAGDEDAAVMLVLTADGIHIMSTSDPYPEKIADGTYAIGSGGKAAWAALLAGRSLEEAMQAAYNCDPYTRPPFDILPLKE